MQAVPAVRRKTKIRRSQNEVRWTVTARLLTADCSALLPATNICRPSTFPVTSGTSSILHNSAVDDECANRCCVAAHYLIWCNFLLPWLETSGSSPIISLTYSIWRQYRLSWATKLTICRDCIRIECRYSCILAPLMFYHVTVTLFTSDW
jgi:hypothetical protein